MITDRKQLSDSDEIILNHEELTKPRNSDSIILSFTYDAVEFVGHGAVSISHIVEIYSAQSLRVFRDVIGSLATAGVLAAVTLKEYVWSLDDYSNRTASAIFTVEALDEYRESLSGSNCRFFYALKRLLMHWHRLGFVGVTPEVYEYLRALPGPSIRQARGRKIRSSNPEEGWYTDQEYEDLITIYWDEYDEGEVDLAPTVARLLTAQYARRPIQLAHLKICDIKEDGESGGVKGPRIEFPSAKERGGGFRQGRQEIHPLSSDLLRLCKAQVVRTINFVEGYLNRDLGEEEKENLPLFLHPTLFVFSRGIARACEFDGSNTYLSSRYLHIQAGEMSRILIRRVGIPVISQRTGVALVEGAYRMRYTRPRQLARAGLSRAALLYWMGHESLTAIDSYYDDPAETARQIDEATSYIMHPIAQAFRGTLRSRESDAIRGDDPASRIELNGRDELAIGTCGSFSECGANVPIPCYRCRFFQPWVQGPHREVLNALERRQAIENDVPKVGTHRNLLNPIQLDRDIEAVRLVIALCDKYLEDNEVQS